MSIDPKNLILSFLVVLIISLLCLCMLLKYNREVTSLKYWIAVVVTIILGLLALIFRAQIQLEYSILITNICVVAGHLLMWVAARTYANRPLRFKIFISVFVFYLFAFLWFTFIEPNINTRLMIAWLLAFPCSLGAACAYLMCPEKRLTFGTKLMIFSMLLNASKSAYMLLTIPLDFNNNMLFDIEKIGLTTVFILNIFISITFTISVVSIVLGEVSKNRKLTLKFESQMQ